MDRDTQQPYQPLQPSEPVQPQQAASLPVSPTATPEVSTVLPEAQAQPPLTPQQQIAQPNPVVQPETYSIDAKMTPVEIEGADDLIGVMHRHEKASSWVVVIGVVLLSCMWFGLAYQVHSVRSSNKVAYEQKVKETSPEFLAKKAEEGFGVEVVDRPDGTLDVSKEVDNLYLAKDQDTDVKVGQQVNFYNGASFIVTGMKSNWEPASKDLIYQPKAGFKFVKIDLVVGNRDKDATSINFEYYVTQANQEIRVNSKSFLPAGSFSEGVIDFSISSGTLNKGQTATVGIVLEVPEKAKDIIFVDRSGAFDKDRNYVTTTMKARYSL